MGLILINLDQALETCRWGKMEHYEGQNVIGVHNAPSYNVPFCPICLFMGFDSLAKNKVINESCFVLNL